jgi:uncharacterized protein YdaU (DUF1376 family)
MKWYKRDPDAALAGMAELTFEERGAYNSLLDLLYSRDGNVPDDDAFCARVFHCRPQVWRRLKLALMSKGKVRETAGKLTANRVETELQTAHKLIENMSQLGRLSAQKRKHFNGSSQRTRPTAASVTTTSTSTEREEENSSKEFSSSLSGVDREDARALARSPDGSRAPSRPPPKPTNARSPNFHWPSDEELAQWQKNQT